MSKVMVGLVGCGFVAELHMYAYKRVYGIDAEVIAVAARGDHVFDFAKKHKIRKTYRDFRDLIDDGEVDVVDICTPPALHAAMIVDAVRAGKHVICEKPSPGISDGRRTKRRSGTKCRNRSCMSALCKRWNGLALRSNPAGNFSCMPRIGSMRPR